MKLEREIVKQVLDEGGTIEDVEDRVDGIKEVGLLVDYRLIRAEFNRQILLREYNSQDADWIEKKRHSRETLGNIVDGIVSKIASADSSIVSILVKKQLFNYNLCYNCDSSKKGYIYFFTKKLARGPFGVFKKKYERTRRDSYCYNCGSHEKVDLYDLDNDEGRSNITSSVKVKMTKVDFNR